MANDVKNTSSKVYRLLSDRCSLRVESAANPLRCCLSWRRACEVRRRGPAGRVRGHRMTGGTPKEVHWTAEQQKRPQRTYRGRKRRETAAKGSTTGRCFRPQNVVFVNPPKDSPEGSRSRFDQNSTRRDTDKKRRGAFYRGRKRACRFGFVSGCRWGRERWPQRRNFSPAAMVT